MNAYQKILGTVRQWYSVFGSPDRKKHWRRSAALFFTLMAAWLLWSGIYTPLLLGLGALSCTLSVYLAHRLGFFNEVTSLDVLPRLPRYWGWLLVAVVKSSFMVSRIILHPKLPISPTVIELEAAPKGPIGQAILGNSITVSPGTVTLDVHDDRLLVHCLTRDTADELLTSQINRRAAQLTSH